MFTGMHARRVRNSRPRYNGKGPARPGGQLLASLTMQMVVLGLAAPGFLSSAAAQTQPSPVPTAPATGSITGQGAPPQVIATQAATATATQTAATATAAQSPTAAPESGPRVPLIVKFKATASAADIDVAIKAAGGQSVRELAQIRSRVISVPENARDQILAATRGTVLWSVPLPQ